MGIRSSNFLVNRDEQLFSCPGTELKSKLRQDDTLLLQRDGLQYTFKLPINLDVISSVSTETVNLNYEQYAYVRDRDTGQKLQETSPPFAVEQAEKRVYSRLFDGDPDSKFKSYTNNGIKHDLVVEFPYPIDVYGSIEIMAGFHSNKRLGQMLINGVVVKEISAWDDHPEIFHVNYTGQVKEFSIRQKELHGSQCTASISYINIDGVKLKSNVTTTKLILAQDTDMSKYKVNMRVKQFGGNVTGVIGGVDESNRTLILTTTAAFQASNEILIDQIDGNPISLPQLLDTDLFVCTDTNDITYKVTGDKFKELFGLPAKINQFNTNVTEVVTGETYKLFWDVTDYKSVEITKPDGNVLTCTGKSDLTFTSPGNTGSLTYTLKAVGTDGSALTQSTSVNVVNPPTPARINSFYVSTNPNPTTGSTYKVTWSTSDAVSVRVYLNGSYSTISTATSGTFSALENSAGQYRYNISALGADGTTKSSYLYVTVSNPPPPSSTLRVTKSPDSVSSGQFCPMNTNSSFNTWTGNCTHIRIQNVGSNYFKNYTGSYSNATIKFKTTSGNRIFEGKINSVTSYSGNVVTLQVSKTFANDNKWPESTDIAVEVTGVW